MAEAQAEPFFVALSALRAQLQAGALAPGARIAAVELADRLGLSTTPVREALSRLAGEGLVEERRGQGYFVRVLTPVDIADLYRLSLAHLLIALDPRRAGGLGAAAAGAEAPYAAGAAVETVEALFRGWVAAAGSRPLFTAFRTVQVQLGPVRRLEAEVLAELDLEAEGLRRILALSRAERLAALRRFHARRIRATEQLAARLQRRVRPPRE